MSDLTPNLISEGIGILFTVLVLARLLVWREKRRWREVRELFLVSANRSCQSILQAWHDWFAVIASAGVHAPLADSDRALLLEGGYYALDEQHVSRLMRIYFGDPLGTNLVARGSYLDRSSIKEANKTLVPYLASRVLPQGHPGWAQLYEQIRPPVQKLSDLVDRFSTLVDPELALAVIRLSIDLDNLESGAYERGSEDKMGHVAVAMTIAHGILRSLELDYYLRKAA